MIPSPTDLHYFSEVAQTGNLSRAADRIGVTQPAVSLAINRLENSLGVILLVRTKNGVKLTRAGQKFAVEARALESEWERIRNEAKRDNTVASGRYTLGCNAALSTFMLPKVLPQLMEHFPAVEFKIAHGLSRQITEDVISFKIDFAIVINPTNHPDLIIKELLADDVTLWISKSHLKKPQPCVDPLSKEAVIIYDPDMPQAQEILKQCTKLKMNFRRSITSSSLEVITSLAASGVGIGIIPTKVAERINTFGLVPYRNDSPRVKDRICLIYRADFQKSDASRKILQFLKRCIGDRSSFV